MTVMEHEPLIRFISFAVVLLLLAIAESLVPRRARVVTHWPRALNNLLLLAVSTVLLRVIPLFSAVATAMWAAEHRFGLLHQFTSPGYLDVLLSLIVLDAAIYGQHVLMHRIPILWSLHRVHHADLDLDVTSGVRFHPIEIVVSMGFKIGVVAILGASVFSVVLFEIIVNATAMFNHSNLKLPIPFDALLRCLLVTPDMHRVHHSVRREETDSNFGFNFPWWDRIFGTYRAQPKDPHDSLTLGLPEWRTADETVRLGRMLLMPFRSNPSPTSVTSGRTDVKR